MIGFKNSGNFKNTEQLLARLPKINYEAILDKYGKEGVEVLASNTPLDSGTTASSWNYKIQRKATCISIIWTNSNIINGVPIAIIIQYGHGTRNGGYVQGRNYINPAIQPIMDKLASKVWEEVIK